MDAPPPDAALEAAARVRRLAPWGLAAGATCIATAPLFVRSLEALGATAIGAYRTAIGAVVLAAWVLARRSGSLAPQGSRPGLLGWSLLAGVVFALDLYVWNRSVLLVGAGMGTILGNTQVFYVGLAGLLFLGERWSWRYGVSVPLAFVGIGMLVGFEAGPATGEAAGATYWLGVGYGLTTGVVYGTYILVLRRLQRFTAAGPAAILALVCTVTALVMGLGALAEGTLRPPSLEEWPALMGIGLIPQVMGWYLISRNLPHVDASRGALILLLQPVLATVLGAIFFAERMGPAQIVGAALTMVAVYLGATRSTSTSAPTPTPTPAPVPEARGASDPRVHRPPR